MIGFRLHKNNDMTQLRQIIAIDYVYTREISLFRQMGHHVSIVLINGRNWRSLRERLKNFSFNEKPVRGDAGISYEQKLSCRYTIYDNNDNSTLSALESDSVILRITYNSGEQEVIGTPDFPVRVSVAMDTDASSEYKVEFQCNTIYRLLTLT